MFRPFRCIGFVAALCVLAGSAFAAPQDNGQWHDDQRGQYHQDNGKPDWQRRVEQQERDQRQQERNQEWQRQQREELRRQAEWQDRRNEAWQRQQEDELQRRADMQRHRDAAWQRSQEDIINRQAGYQVYDTGRYRHGHRWERGHRYDGPIYVVNDYDRYRLRQPPRGYRWVRDGDDGNYLLVAIATNVILDIVSR